MKKLALQKFQTFLIQLKVLLESVLRQYDAYVIKEEHVNELAKWGNGADPEAEVPFKPSRVVLQDFTGVPVVVDLASLRSAMKEMGGDQAKSTLLFQLTL